MKIAHSLGLFVLALAACSGDRGPARHKTARSNVADLNGVWCFVGPQSNDGQLLNISDGKIEGFVFDASEYSKTDKGKTLAFRGKIKSINATSIDLEQDGPQPESTWSVFTAQYDFDLRQEPTGEMLLWIDFLHRPELKDAGFWYHKLENNVKSKELEKPATK